MGWKEIESYLSKNQTPIRMHRGKNRSAHSQILLDIMDEPEIIGIPSGSKAYTEVELFNKGEMGRQVGATDLIFVNDTTMYLVEAKYVTCNKNRGLAITCAYDQLIKDLEFFRNLNEFNEDRIRLIGIAAIQRRDDYIEPYQLPLNWRGKEKLIGQLSELVAA